MKEKGKIAALLKNERESLGLTLKEVTKKMGFVHYQTLSSIESGERSIKAWELAKLANIYGRDIDFFLRADAVKTEVEVLWRNPEESTRREEIKRKFLFFCEKYKNLLHLLGERIEENRELFLPFTKNSLLNLKSYEYVAEIASNYLNLLELGSRPACSLAKILEEKLGIKIIYLDLDPDISGGSIVGDFGMAILINANDAPWRRNYDLAHEFFHLASWDYFSPAEIYKKDNKGKNRIEQLADVFASALLLPEDELRNEFNKRARRNSISYLDLIEIAGEFEVSIEALLWRLVNLGLIKKETVRMEIEKGNIKKLDQNFRPPWETVRTYISPKYISLAIKAFQLGKISKAKFAEYIDKKFSEVTSFLKEYGYDENEDYSVVYRTT